MKQNDRYDISELLECQFEPGSRGHVLKNRLGVARRREIDEIEDRKQPHVLNEFVNMYDRRHRFSVIDICQMHKIWGS